MGDIKEIRPGVSQEPDPNPLGEKAQRRLGEINRGVAAFLYVTKLSPENSASVRGILYGGFPDRELGNDTSLAARVADTNLTAQRPFIEAVEKFQAIGQPLTHEVVEALTDLLPVPDEKPENMIPFEADPVLREFYRSAREIATEVIKEMERVSEEYIEDVRRIVSEHSQPPTS